MNMIDVVSSNLRAVGYNDETLRVEFVNGTTYEFYDVPKNVYESLISADSVGGYFNANVKNLYTYVRL